MSRFAPTRRAARRAAVLAAAGFGLVASFQAVLAAGAPLGHAAWGGGSAGLSTGERIGSAISVVVWGCAAFVVLGRAGFWARAGDTVLFRWGTWFVAGVTAISAVVNLASRSRWESVVWGPIALILAVLCVIVARGPAGPGRPSASTRGAARRDAS
jgi:hypothetical protein